MPVSVLVLTGSAVGSLERTRNEAAFNGFGNYVAVSNTTESMTDAQIDAYELLVVPSFNTGGNTITGTALKDVVANRVAAGKHCIAGFAATTITGLVGGTMGYSYSLNLQEVVVVNPNHRVWKKYGTVTTDQLIDFDGGDYQTWINGAYAGTRIGRTKIPRVGEGGNDATVDSMVVSVVEVGDTLLDGVGSNPARQVIAANVYCRQRTYNASGLIFLKALADWVTSPYLFTSFDVVDTFMSTNHTDVPDVSEDFVGFFSPTY